MNCFIDGVRSLIDAHNDKLNELAKKSTVGMSSEEIAQAIEDGGCEIAANLRRLKINVDYLLEKQKDYGKGDKIQRF